MFDPPHMISGDPVPDPPDARVAFWPVGDRMVVVPADLLGDPPVIDLRPASVLRVTDSQVGPCISIRNLIADGDTRAHLRIGHAEYGRWTQIDDRRIAQQIRWDHNHPVPDWPECDPGVWRIWDWITGDHVGRIEHPGGRSVLGLDTAGRKALAGFTYGLHTLIIPGEEARKRAKRR